MKIIYNKHIPLEGFLAINLFGVLFVRDPEGYYKKNGLSSRVIRHEEIYTAQMKELWYIGFYLLYFLSWLFRLFYNTKKAYKSIPFEREAYDNERKPTYLSKRKKFAWLQYAFKRI